MRNVWTIAKKELKADFISPVAYVVIFTIVLTLSIFFYSEVYYTVSTQGSAPDIQVVFQLLVFPLLFLAVPAITMRSITEENKMGTIELILTAPVRDWELIVGKWLGSLFFFIIMLAITWFYPLVLNPMVSPGIDQGVLISGYLGLVLLISAMCAVGVFVSSLFSNQIASLFTTLLIIIVFWIISYPGQLMSGWGGDVLRYLSMPDHFSNTFQVGIIELKDVIFYLSITALGLFLGTITIESRRWK
jgi:ABC-2 type transport system permease protein